MAAFLYLGTNPGASKWNQVRFEVHSELWFILRYIRGVLRETHPSLRSAGDERGWTRIPEPMGWALAGPNENPERELADRSVEISLSLHLTSLCGARQVKRNLAVLSWKAPG